MATDYSAYAKTPASVQDVYEVGASLQTTQQQLRDLTTRVTTVESSSGGGATLTPSTTSVTDPS